MPAGEREPAPSDVTADAAEGLCVGVSEEVVSKTMTLQIESIAYSVLIWTL